MSTSIRASIDLGTNTCLLLIAEVSGGKVSEIIEEKTCIVRLGEGLAQTGLLSRAAVERTLECLRDYSNEVRKHGLDPKEAVCIATASARDCTNGAEFFERVRKETAFSFKTISGDEEARLTFLGGLLPAQDQQKTAVIDIGGGSTELMAVSGGKSLDIGSVKITETFLKSDPVTDDEFWAVQELIDAELESLKSWRESLPEKMDLTGVAGTVTTLAQWQLEMREFDREKLDGAILTRGDVHRQVEELKWRTVKERSELPGIPEKRADVLLAGALILWRAMEILNFPECRVSTRGIRYGALMEKSP